jgi:hypothetical protein
MFEFGGRFGLRKGIAYRLQAGELDKSHGWIYIGKCPCELPKDIAYVYHDRINNSRQTYSFYHPAQEIFVGTLPEFIASNNITKPQRTTIHRLVNGKRKMAWGWIFIGEGNLHPPNIHQIYSEALSQNTKANNHMDTPHYFTNFKTGERFQGTLQELIKSHNLNDGAAREMLGGRKPHLKGWTIKS